MKKSSAYQQGNKRSSTSSAAGGRIKKIKPNSTQTNGRKTQQKQPEEVAMEVDVVVDNFAIGVVANFEDVRTTTVISRLPTFQTGVGGRRRR